MIYTGAWVMLWLCCFKDCHRESHSIWLPHADGTGLSFAAVQGILAGCIVAVVACLAVTALLVYLCARRAARLRGVGHPKFSTPHLSNPLWLFAMGHPT